MSRMLRLPTAGLAHGEAFAAVVRSRHDDTYLATLKTW
jgi:hypothetical protein